MWKALLLSTSGDENRWDEALADIRRAHELNPNDFFTLHALGYIETLYGYPQEGVEHLHAAIRTNPRDRWIFNVCVVLTFAYFLLKQYENGVEWGMRAVREAPNLPMAHSNLALCQIGLRKINDAKQAMAEARRPSPEYVDARVAGYAVVRRLEDRRRYTTFLRVAAGVDDPAGADALR